MALNFDMVNGRELNETREESSNFDRHFNWVCHQKNEEKEKKELEKPFQRATHMIHIIFLGEKKSVYCDCGILATKSN